MPKTTTDKIVALPSVTPVHVDAVTIDYGNTAAVRDVTLQFPTGRCTALVGPSGCGKTSLIRAIVGLIQPTTGSIKLGKQILHRGNANALRQQMGYVIQEGGLFPHMTAWANVTLMARHGCWEPANIQRRVEELSELTKLTPEQLQRYPFELSGGQRQRICMMRALMLDPEILLLDEPLGALDPMIRASVQDDLKHIFDCLRKTVILVTHDLAEADYLTEWMILMRDGFVVQQGTLRDFQRSPTEPFVTEFISAQRHVTG